MTSTILLKHFPSEILSDILNQCDTLEDLLCLSTTCRRMRSLYKARKVQYLARAVEHQYGPLHDAIQLVTYNISQPAHVVRGPPHSEALLRQVIRHGRIATAWEDVFPTKHWHTNFEDRRLLTSTERRRLRRAIYRLWLYDVAFHTAAVSRHVRMSPQFIRERTLLLHNWDNAALAEIANIHTVLREVLRSVCPSNGAIERKFRKRFPDSTHTLLFNGYAHRTTAPFLPSSTDILTHALPTKYAKYHPTPTHEPGAEGWGDDISHYYVIEDMLKLNPLQILWLRNHAPAKRDVERYVRGLGEWFENNGETFEQTLDVVLAQRGVDVGGFREMVERGCAGVAALR